MLDSSLDKIAEKILSLDEASLSSLWEKYKYRMEHFETSKEWEKSVIIFFIINAVRVKNRIFNDQILLMQRQSEEQEKPVASKGRPMLRRIK
ncbi:MAG: hypothetical protein A4E70_00241 [Syntrophus sp. PtaU1.Bin005]|jgi:hypothetical protein|uniref:hypothetical protein n=1 Tax=Syntrophus TaxID=43773 RepID=UPI0009D136BF|nr:MAG: hypothetical protein A4E69_00717 [Syntrophus sp. PtaB.Bin138]OPY83470.1 MAG: hypothetical protein A4E70_00241 [Syntrophus sp. PtaU1.Bin005]